jgi:hypothetical protein
MMLVPYALFSSMNKAKAQLLKELFYFEYVVEFPIRLHISKIDATLTAYGPTG